MIRAQNEIGADSSENEKKLQDFKKGKDKALLSESLLACRRSVGECILISIISIIIIPFEY